MFWSIGVSREETRKTVDGIVTKENQKKQAQLNIKPGKEITVQNVFVCVYVRRMRWVGGETTTAAVLWKKQRWWRRDVHPMSLRHGRGLFVNDVWWKFSSATLLTIWIDDWEMIYFKDFFLGGRLWWNSNYWSRPRLIWACGWVMYAAEATKNSEYILSCLLVWGFNTDRLMFGQSDE